jgi:hypothetical protein
MNSQSKLICLKEAAKISGYHQDYLGHLIRTGKLSGQKIGRSWMTTKSDLNAFMQKGSDSPLRSFVYSSFGLALTFALLIIAIMGVTFVVTLSVQNSSANAADSHVEDQLNNSSVDGALINSGEAVGGAAINHMSFTVESR